MKSFTKLLYAILFFHTALAAYAQTNVSGGIVNGTMTLAGSPYNVQGSIQILNGDLLIIEPGVTINFQGTYKLLVLGKLKAIGTVTDSITFTAANITNGWRGMRFDNTNASNDTSKVQYCKLQYGRATGSSPDNNGGGLYFDNFSKVVVSHSRIINCSANNAGAGLYINSGSPTIKYNIIANDSLSSGGMSKGGGIYIQAGSPLISHNTISNNTSSASHGLVNYGPCEGGGIYVASGSPFIANNIISRNSAMAGGGIYVYNGTPTIHENIISDNFSTNGGGIFGTWNISFIISNNTIFNNSTKHSGGGITINSNVIITDNTIVNNTTDGEGGGIMCYTNTATIKNNFICNNSALGGGGIQCIGSASTTLIYNNVIANNNATNGAGLLCHASPTLTNNTIVNNSASHNGGALSCSGGSPILRNCILYGNTAATTGDQIYLSDEPSDPSFYYCDVEGSNAAFELNGNFYTGTYQNNIYSVPQFVSPSAGSGIGFNGLTADWSLQSGSPCVAAGDPSGTYPVTDIAGNPRVYGLRIDIGAYEYQSAATGVAELSSQNDFLIYPNPSIGKITIQSSENISKIEIANMLGETVYQSSAITNQSTIDLSSQPGGVYFLQINSTHGIVVQKVILSK